MLVATISEGGMAIGAFDGDRLVGSVYGFATHQPEVLHSHYLAVDPDYRRERIGVGLEAPAAGLVPGQRAHDDALDIRPAAARQRPPQPALAAARSACSITSISTDRWAGSTAACRAIGSSSNGTSLAERFTGYGIDRGARYRRSPPTRSPRRRPAALRRAHRVCARHCCRCSPTDWQVTDVDRDARTLHAHPLTSASVGRSQPRRGRGRPWLTLAVSQSP